MRLHMLAVLFITHCVTWTCNWLSVLFNFFVIICEFGAHFQLSNSSPTGCFQQKLTSTTNWCVMIQLTQSSKLTSNVLFFVLTKTPIFLFYFIKSEPSRISFLHKRRIIFSILHWGFHLDRTNSICVGVEELSLPLSVTVIYCQEICVWKAS